MKKILALLLALVMVLSMAACGAKEEAPAAEAPKADAPAAEAPAADAGIELTYWSMWNSTEGQAKIIQEAADAYYAKTGIKINIEWKGRDVKKLIQPALDAGEKVDIFDTDYALICQTFSKYVVDVTDMAEAAGYADHCLPVLMETAKGYCDGALKVIPYQPYTSGVWYNKDMFTAAGIEKTPETFAELLDVCQKLKDSGVNPFTCDQGDGTALLVGYQLARYLGQAGVLDLIDNVKWGEVPEAKKAAEDIYSLFEKGYMSPYAPSNYPDGQNELGFGESAMLLQASWVPNEVVQNTGAELNWGYFPWPAVEGGVDGIEGGMLGAQAFAVTEVSEHKQEAFDFLMTVVIGEFDLKMADAVSSAPADTDNTVWPNSVAGAEPYFKNMTKSYEWAVGLQNNADYMEFIQEAINQLCKMEITPDQFIANLEALK